MERDMTPRSWNPVALGSLTNMTEDTGSRMCILQGFWSTLGLRLCIFLDNEPSPRKSQINDTIRIDSSSDDEKLTKSATTKSKSKKPVEDFVLNFDDYEEDEDENDDEDDFQSARSKTPASTMPSQRQTRLVTRQPKSNTVALAPSRRQQQSDSDSDDSITFKGGYLDILSLNK